MSADAKEDFLTAVAAVNGVPVWDAAMDAGADLLAMLRECEWVYVDSAGVAFCPCCKHAEDVGMGGGHAPDCRLDALLRRFR